MIHDDFSANAAPGPGVHDLGDGMAEFRADGKAFRLDLWDFHAWRSSYTPPNGADGYAMLDAIADEVERRTGVRLRRGQVDSLLHAIELEHERIRFFRERELGSLRSSGST